ncbi:MAG: two-component system sensor histidine kinase FlrB [Oceanospirillaceae bacterium]|jgi:two-component system sensor histidine kinase FlrB
MTECTKAELMCENALLKEQLQQYENKQPLLDDRLKQLLDVMPAGVVVINSLGVVQQCNPAASHLLNDPLEGRNWRDIVARCFAPQADDGHEVSLHDGKRLSIDTRALLDNQGQLVLLTNLTETRNLQGRLAHFQRLGEMGKMMASLAHQIRTPLSAALLYTSNLTRPDLTPNNRVKFANKAKVRLLNIEQQISDMLIFARGESQLKDRIQLSQFFSELEDSLDVPLSQHDADCDLSRNEIELELVCNKDILLGAILNVVINALQACEKDAHIKINAQLVDAWLVLSVIDNGPGMDAQSLSKVQEPFYTTKSHGTGLGLSVASVVAKAHNGRFEIASEPGKGTVAGFWIPVNYKTSLQN